MMQMLKMEKAKITKRIVSRAVAHSEFISNFITSRSEKLPAQMQGIDKTILPSVVVVKNFFMI
jgi:hypothetical protein